MYKYSRKYDFCEHSQTYYRWYTWPNGKKYCVCTECELIVWEEYYQYCAHDKIHYRWYARSKGKGSCYCKKCKKTVWERI